MNGSQSTEAQHAPPISPANEASDSDILAKKRKKDDLKPIITAESASQQESQGYVLKSCFWASVIRCFKCYYSCYA